MHSHRCESGGEMFGHTKGRAYTNDSEYALFYITYAITIAQSKLSN